MKLFLVLALISGSAFAGDQGNGGYAGCTIDCPPPCTEDCDPGNGLTAGVTSEPFTVSNSEIDLSTFDIIVVYATEYYRLFI